MSAKLVQVIEELVETDAGTTVTYWSTDGRTKVGEFTIPKPIAAKPDLKVIDLSKVDNMVPLEDIAEVDQ